MITIDENIFSSFISPEIIFRMNYIEYFGPEIKNFLTEELLTKYFSKRGYLSREEFLKLIPNEFSDDFYEKRKSGENDNILCEMIRNKKTKEFIAYVNKNDISLNAYTENSIFETNSYLNFDENSLLHKRNKLIEYASFFGSNEIIKYMEMNGVELKSKIWLYATHSQNSELIQYLEDNQIPPSENDQNNYEPILEESIKCHHNEISKYIIYNLINEDNSMNDNDNEYLYKYGLKYYNYCFIPDNITANNAFCYLCEFDYYQLVKLFLQQEHIDINTKDINKKSIF